MPFFKQNPINTSSNPKLERKLRTNKRLTKILVILLAPFVVGFIIEIIFFAWGLLFGFRNAAQDELKPVLSQVEAMGGYKICDNGDPGLGPDNLDPWYHIYYELPGALDLATRIKSIAGPLGYQLKDDAVAIEGSKESVPRGDADYWQAVPFKNRELRVVVHRSGTLGLECSKDYGKTKAIDAGRAVVEVDLILYRSGYH